jgi:hypothetical protein
MGGRKMKNINAGRNGFVMLFVIAVLGLIGIYMIILASESNAIIFQADRAYLEACRQNLTSSGLAWAKKNVNAPAGDVSLDTADMNIKKAALNVVLQKKSPQIEISTSCSRGRQTLNSTRKFTLEVRP